jgi:hypothetical protein
MARARHHRAKQHALPVKFQADAADQSTRIAHHTKIGQSVAHAGHRQGMLAQQRLDGQQVTGLGGP